MTDRRKIRDVLWSSLYSAKLYQESIIDCWGDDEKEKPVIEAYKDIAAIDKLMVKLFGGNKSELDVRMSNCKSIGILELKELFEKDIEG